MKTQTTPKARSLWRASLAEISGLRDSGFFENEAVELKNMRPCGGALRLRDGILKGIPLAKKASFVGSANVSGSMTGFYSDGSNTYAVSDFGENMSAGSWAFGSLSDRDFVFNLSGSTFIYKQTERQFYMLGSGGFEVAERGSPVRAVRGNRAERADVALATSLFDGLARIDFELTASTTALDLGEMPGSITSVVCRSNAVSYTPDKKTLLFSESIPSGSTVSVTFRPSYMSENPSQPYFVGACSEDDSEVYLYTASAIYRASLSDGKLCISAPVLTVSGSLQRVFRCEDRTLAVVGTSVGEVDIEQGRVRMLKNGNVRSAKEVCPIGPCAYLYGNGRVERLSVSRSGGEAELACVTLPGGFFKQMRGEIVSLAYSPRDRTLWLLYKMAYSTARVYVFEEDSGVWFEICGAWKGSPTHFMPIRDGVGIVTEDGIFFSHPDFIRDIDGSTYSDIEGEVTLCGTICSDPTARKRLLSIGAQVSGPSATVSLRAQADNGREDGYRTVTEPDARGLSALFCRVNVGRFRSLTLSASVLGVSHTVLHELYADISR